MEYRRQMDVLINSVLHLNPGWFQPGFIAGELIKTDLYVV